MSDLDQEIIKFEYDKILNLMTFMYQKVTNTFIFTK